MAGPAIASTPLNHWLRADQETWSMSPTVAAWPAEYARRIAHGYGRLLAYAGNTPITPPSVDAFVRHLGTVHSPATVASYLLDLCYALAVLRPEDGWAWLRQRCRELRPKETQPSEPKPARKPAVLRVPFESWSDDQRARWLQALSRGSRRSRYRTRKERHAAAEPETQAEAETDLQKAMPPHRWTPAYRRRVERGWGMWLGWVRTQDGVDELPTPEAVSRFVGACESRKNSTITMASYVWEIRRAAEVLWPEDHWTWLKDDARFLDLEAEPVRDKWQQFVPIDEAFRLGVELMLEALDGPPTVQNAIKFRDGYALSFISLRPKRAKNIAECRVGVHLVLDAQGTPVQLHWPVTKNGEPSTVPYPAALAKLHGAWWIRFRPILLGNKPDLGHLWIGQAGDALTAGQIYKRLRHWTKERLGVAIGTHALRTNFATTFAAADGRLLSMVQVMLDHRRPSSMRPYQLIGDQFSAARTLEELQRPAIKEAIGRMQRKVAVFVPATR